MPKKVAEVFTVAFLDEDGEPACLLSRTSEAEAWADAADFARQLMGDTDREWTSEDADDRNVVADFNEVWDGEQVIGVCKTTLTAS